MSNPLKALYELTVVRDVQDGQQTYLEGARLFVDRPTALHLIATGCVRVDGTPTLKGDPPRSGSIGVH